MQSQTPPQEGAQAIQSQTPPQGGAQAMQSQTPPQQGMPHFPQMSQNGYPFNDAPPVYYQSSAETLKQRQERADIFCKLMPPTLLYGILYTFFLYENFSSITMPFFVAVTVAYCYYVLPIMGISWKKDSWFYCVAMLLLGVSTATTGNGALIFFNNLGILLLLVCMLLHNYFDDHKWTFGKYLVAFVTAIFGAIGCISEPFTDGSCYQKESHGKQDSKIMYILLGVVISIPLLAVIVVLLYYADAVFAEVIRRIDLNFVTIFWMLVMYLFAVFSAYCGLRYLGKRRIKEECKDHKKFEPLVAVTVLTLISIVYVFFSMIQILYLFLGQLELPVGYTYARYAREGFFQLLFVCVLNVVIVLFVLGFFRKNKVLNVLMTVISACTYIMSASSAMRMYLYVRAYQLSVLRILVFWLLLMIAFLLAGILVQIYREQFQLFRYGLVVVCVCYLALSFSHPDYWIAKYNLSQMAQQSAETKDYFYLADLSSDAAPVIVEQSGDWVDRYKARMSHLQERSIRQYNFSEARARKLFGL